MRGDRVGGVLNDGDASDFISKREKFTGFIKFHTSELVDLML